MLSAPTLPHTSDVCVRAEPRTFESSTTPERDPVATSWAYDSGPYSRMARTGRSTAPRSAQDLGQSADGGTGLQMEAGQVEALVAEDDEEAVVTDGVDDDVPALAPGHDLAEFAHAHLLARALAQAERRRREGGEHVRPHFVGVGGDQHSVHRRDGGVAHPRDLLTQRVQLLEHQFLIH